MMPLAKPPAGKAQAVCDPEPGDLRVALLQPTILGRRGLLPDLSQPSLPGAVRAGAFSSEVEAVARDTSDRAPKMRPNQDSSLPRLALVLGGARSGKSGFAERLVESAGVPAIYIATAEARDDEMRQRIAAHRARRGPDWTTIEEPLELAACLESAGARARPILVDCLTLFLSNLLGARRDAGGEIARLLAVLPRLQGPIVMVANEVGLGIVPENEAAREFRDHAGRLNQGVAAQADRVVFMAAGLPLTLKG